MILNVNKNVELKVETNENYGVFSVSLINENDEECVIFTITEDGAATFYKTDTIDAGLDVMQQ